MPLVFGKDLKKCRYLPPKRYHTRIAPKKIPCYYDRRISVQVSITPDKKSNSTPRPSNAADDRRAVKFITVLPDLPSS